MGEGRGEAGGQRRGLTKHPETISQLGEGEDDAELWVSVPEISLIKELEAMHVVVVGGVEEGVAVEAGLLDVLSACEVVVAEEDTVVETGMLNTSPELISELLSTWVELLRNGCAEDC